MDFKKWANQVQKDIGLDDPETMAKLAEVASENIESTPVEFKRSNETITEEFKQKMIKRTERSIKKWNEPVGGKIVALVSTSKMPDINAVRDAFDKRKATPETTRIAAKLSMHEIDRFIEGIQMIAGKDATLLNSGKAYIRLDWESGASKLETKDAMLRYIKAEREIASRLMDASQARVRPNMGSQTTSHHRGKSIELSAEGIKSFFRGFKKKKK